MFNCKSLAWVTALSFICFWSPQALAQAELPEGRSQIWSAAGSFGTTANAPPTATGLGVPSPTEEPQQVFTLTVPAGYDDLTLLEVRLDWDTAFKDYLWLEVQAPGGSVQQSIFVNTAYQEVSFADPEAGEYTVVVHENRTLDGEFTLAGHVTRASADEQLEPIFPLSSDPGVDDVVVIAVVDSSINPYHWDYVGRYMPQHQNETTADDLPLDQDPATWLAGHPGAAAFNRYEAVNVTLELDDPSASTADLHAADATEWAKIEYSTGTMNQDVNMYWFPGTKIIGHVAFGPGYIGDPVTGAVIGESSGPVDTFAASSHGIGSSSVSAGNLHGSCSRCLLVYVHGTSEQANEWIARQDWIDLQTNSWGYSLTVRDRIYAGSDTELQKRAVNRGQSIFFSAGNGQANAFVVPNPTLFSSQEGPDWIVTVGAIDPDDGSSFSGHGKPADIASIGSGYPSAYNGNGTTTAEGNFSGTSNATPVVAGMYGEALYRIRRILGGPSRVQADGVIATGEPGCGSENPNCALADGKLTVHELQDALFKAAQHTEAGTNLGGLIGLPETENVAELELLSEGHGSFFGRVRGELVYEQEVRRIVDYALGHWFVEETAEETAWYVADSICRQSAWGAWAHGYAATNTAPDPSPEWPVRTFLAEGCPQVLPPIVEAERAYQAAFATDETPADADDDAVPDDQDNCPNTRNADQADTDGDGVGDACEVAEPDRDADGIADAVDNCPDDANPGQEDADTDGLGDVCDPTPNGSGGGNTAGPGSTIDAVLAVSGDGSEAEDEAVNGDAETVFTFDASASGYTDAEGSDLRYTFVFGDEASEEEFASATSDPIATHSYGAAGTYTAYVIVSDAFGNSDTSNSVTITTTITITVEGDNGTVAQLTVDETSGPAPLRVAFDGSRSFTSEGKTITEYCFDFDDGEAPQCGTEATAVYVYTRPGSYEPSLTVTASDESTATAKATVNVGGTGSNPGTPSQPTGSTGGGSGALGGLLLLPLLGFGLARRRG